MKNIRRRKTTHQPQPLQQPFEACVEVGRFGIDGEVDVLKRDKEILMVELVKLRQQQQNTRNHLQSMENRLKRTELRHQQMMKFLARAMQNPNLLQQLAQQREWRKELEEAISNKRRKPIDYQGPSDVEECSAFVKLEQEEYNDISEELEACDMDLVTNMGEQSGSQKNTEEEEKGGAELESRNEDFEGVLLWEEFLNEGAEEDLLGLEECEEDINVLG